MNKDETIWFGTYPHEADGTRMPIEWNILERRETKLLIISRFGIDAVQYHPSKEAVWEDCALRKWLNGKFIETAFSAEEQTAILETENPADKNPDYDIPAGNSTIDKVFILSIPEAKRLFPSNKDRATTATPYAEKRGACINDVTRTSWWWLRSPGRCSGDAAVVNIFGSIRTDGNYMDALFDCVRPVLWLDTEKIPEAILKQAVGGHEREAEKNVY